MATGTVSFAITPHKVSMCVLIETYALPAASQSSMLPFPFSSVSQHNRLGLFLFSLTKSFDDIMEPKLEDLVTQLREIGGSLGERLIDHLTDRLSSLSSPDDLFTFFGEIRGILGGSKSVIEDNQLFLDPNSHLGMFLRRCVLTFHVLSFEGVCHLLTNLSIYCKDALSNYVPYELRRKDDSGNELDSSLEYENMELENFVFGKVTEELEERNQAGKRVSFHLHVPRPLSALVEDIDVVSGPRTRQVEKGTEVFPYVHPPGNSWTEVDTEGNLFLRTNWQVQGYLMEKADAIEKHGGCYFLSVFENCLRHISKVAPELHRVHFLRYLNSLYHEDYFAALESLHCYFDYSAGAEGLDFLPSSGSNNSARYEVALLCLGMMHSHFGHPKQALEVLVEAVRVSQQQSNDSCLAYTLAAICNLLSEYGGSSTAEIFGTSYCPVTSMGTSMSIKQQLFVLLKESLKRAENLKLKRLVASNHLAMAKFNLKHVQRPLLSFGPKASMKLRTYPANICKELRLCSNLMSEFSSESSGMIADGAFSTTWLNNLPKAMSSGILSQDYGRGSSSNSSQYCAQPSSIPKSVLQLVGSSYLQRATAWEMYGSATLAKLNALVFTTCFVDASSSSDASLAYAKLIQHIAVSKGYREAFAALKVAEEKFLSISRSVMLLLKLQLLHEYALHCGHLKQAQQVCDELGVLASSVTGVDMPLKIEASIRRARTLLAAKQFSQAVEVAQSLFHMCYKSNMQVENASILLLLAEIHKKSGNAVLGLPYALASISYCQAFNLDLLKASATLTLAELWLSLGANHAKRALTLIHGALPMLHGHGGLELRARAQIAEAKCHLSDPSYSVSKDPEVVLDPLRQASEWLEVIEYHELAAEAFYLMAIIYDKLGQLEEREEAATVFKKHIMALENPRENDDPVANML